MILEGSGLPELDLPDHEGRQRKISDLAGPEGLVIYVYPKDDTPGCTIEAQDFRDRVGAFAERGFRVVGVSRDSAESHCRFAEKYDLPFPLLTDADGSWLERVGAWGEKKLYGKTHVGIIRSTFVVDPRGLLLKAYKNVRAKGHAERVLRDLPAAG